MKEPAHVGRVGRVIVQAEGSRVIFEAGEEMSSVSWVQRTGEER